MAFDPRSLSPLFYSNGSTVWLYRSGADALAAIGGGGYFDAVAARLRVSDWIMVAAPDGATALAVAAVGGGVSVVAGLGGTIPAPAPVITVTTPASQSGNAPYTVPVSGTWGGGNSGAVEVATSIDGGATWSGWSVLVAAPGGGTYAGSVVFASAGAACRVRTRMTGAPGVVAVSASFQLAQAAQPGLDETTAVSGVGGTGASVAAGGAANNELTLGAPFVALRADDPTRITTAGGAVSQWAGIAGVSAPAAQGTAANQPVHNAAGGYVSFTSSGNSDPAGDWLDIPALGTLYQSGQSDAGDTRLGIAYQLFRLPATLGYDALLHRVGANNNSFIYPSRRAHLLGIYGGVLRVMRGDGSSAAQADAGPCPVNEWIALAHVFNDDRTTPGTSDNVSRIFAKTKAGGTWATMVAASSPAKQVIYHPSTLASINRARYNGTTSDSSATVDIAAFYFDRQPPRTNAEIEANLDKLLARI